MDVTCHSCGSNVVIPEGFTGVQKQCRSCRKFVQVPRQPQQASQPQAEMDALADDGGGRKASSVRARGTGVPRRRKVRYRKPVERDDGFELERKGMNSGMVGGIALMAIAAIWFFAGLAAGIIFFYPPVLFFFGVVGFISGLTSGNVAGGARRVSRVRRRR